MATGQQEVERLRLVIKEIIGLLKMNAPISKQSIIDYAEANLEHSAESEENLMPVYGSRPAE